MMCFVTMGEWSNKELAKNQGVRQAIVQVVHSRQPVLCLQNSQESSEIQAFCTVYPPII